MEEEGQRSICPDKSIWFSAEGVPRTNRYMLQSKFFWSAEKMGMQFA
jgi:hypothetical protein